MFNRKTSYLHILKINPKWSKKKKKVGIPFAINYTLRKIWFVNEIQKQTKWVSAELNYMCRHVGHLLAVSQLLMRTDKSWPACDGGGGGGSGGGGGGGGKEQGHWSLINWAIEFLTENGSFDGLLVVRS